MNISRNIGVLMYMYWQNFVFDLDCSTSEEDGGFGVYGEKTRYATLQRLRTDGSQLGSHHHPNGGYETLRPNGSCSAYNVPSLVSCSYKISKKS